MNPSLPHPARFSSADLTAIEVITEILASTGPTELGERLVSQLQELTGARTVLLLGHPSDAVEHELVAISPQRRAALFPPGELGLFCAEHDPSAWPVRPEELPSDHAARATLLRAGVASVLRFPLRATGTTLGMLVLLDLPEVERSTDVRTIVAFLTPLIALALRSAFAHRQIERQARQSEQTARELERRVAERTAELLAANRIEEESRLAALNVMEDAVAARDRTAELLAALQESEERYRRLVDNSPVAIVVFEDGRIVFVNDAAVALAGAGSRTDLIGTPVLDWVHPDCRELATERTRQVLESGATTPLIEMKFLRADGSIAETEIVATPFAHEGRPAVQVVLQDLTERKRAQADFKMLFDTMLDGFALHEIICDATGRPVDYRFKAINPAFTRLTGLTAEQAVGRTVMELMPQTEPFWIETYGRVALTGEPAQFEHYSAALGRYFEVAAFRNAPGQFAVVFVDETSRALAQQALARNEAELAAIYDHAPVMMLLIDGERKVRRLNRAALEFTGNGPDDAVGQRAGDLLGCLHALDDSQGCGFGPECGVCALRRVTLDALVNGTTSRRIETHPRMVRGREVVDVTLLASAAPLTVANATMVLLCLEDISQQKLAEQRVREQAALLDVTRDAIIVIDFDGQVTSWNRGAEELYGWTAAEAVGRPLVALVFDEAAQPAVEAAWTAIRLDGRWSGELRQRNRAGEPLITLCRGVLMHTDTEVAGGMLFSASDITESKRYEAQYLRAQRLDSLGSLAGGVAHDLNNVFTPILMSIEMLRDSSSESYDRELIQLMEDSTRRGVDVVRQLLLYGRGSDSPRGEVNLELVIGDIRRMMQETFPKSIELATQSPTELWPVHADQTQMHQVLLNLCVNARDAMPRGGRLTIAAENAMVDEALAARQIKAHPGRHVVLRVSDTGGGIPPEVIDKIYDPFFTTKPLGQGTGLGLATVLGIVRSHGGFITVQSAVGVGSEFAVYLPAMQPAGTATSVPAAVRTLPGRGELVLVVDDEINIQIMLEMALTRNGYSVVRACDGTEAVSIVTARGVAVRVVITDMMMPKADGLSAARTLRTIRPQLPIVAISGVPGHRIELDQLPGPKVRFLTKPFSIDQLLPEVRAALDANPGG